MYFATFSKSFPSFITYLVITYVFLNISMLHKRLLKKCYIYFIPSLFSSLQIAMSIKSNFDTISCRMLRYPAESIVRCQHPLANFLFPEISHTLQTFPIMCNNVVHRQKDGFSPQSKYPVLH